MSERPGVLQPSQVEAIYTISQAVAGAGIDTEAALDQIFPLLRSVFIFDSVVIYNKSEENVLEPTFARAIGRGRFLEADLAWGGGTAQEALNSRNTAVRVEDTGDETSERTDIRYSIGLPLKAGNQIIGVLVFLRFGGPAYEPEQIYLAEFIAVLIAELLKTNQMARQIANLEAQRQLDQLQDDFIATITHELLTPLGFIKGYATTLLREDTEWDAQVQREFLTIIDEEADRLHELIDNLMDSSRLQAGTLRMSMQTVRLDTMLRDLTMRQVTRNESLKIHLNILAPGLLILADPGRLTQVFDNIINNALKYAPASPIYVTLDRDENLACISIQDKGPGIAEEHLEKIFQRFYRVLDQNTTARGTGMGLYICRKIIQAHGGSIEAKSKPGLGTTFYIHIPLQREADVSL